MLRIWQKTEKQKLEPVGMGTAFPFLKEKNHVVSIIGGRRKNDAAVRDGRLLRKKRSEGTGDNFDAHLPSAEGMA